MQPQSSTVYGLIMETATYVGLQRLRISSFGTLIPDQSPTICEPKACIMKAKFIPTADESEAISHMKDIWKVKHLLG